MYSKHSLVQLLNELNFNPNKDYGQNFLIDRSICETFAQSATLDPDKDAVLEIGPGFGQVTEFLIEHCQQLYVIELDKTCARFLEKKYAHQYSTARMSGKKAIQLGDIPASAHLAIVEGDALAVPFPHATKIVSSVPYSICYKLMLKIINTWNYESVHLILQKEFVDHILAETGQPGYTVMAAFAGYYLLGERLLEIPTESFYPEPDVQSLIVKFTPKPTIAINTTEAAYREKYLVFLEGLFPYITWSFTRAAKTFQEKKPKIAANFQHLTQAVERSEYKDTWIRNIPPEGLFRIMVESLHYIP
ncbi:MAG TPA: rRNA adenine dimethyltransferase family protein [Candidatus Lokiarchaeia archaeon]|nr:rRNA adenine dimethyltransferase family protein [Candidatus Lokiarchaeia archaeon]